MAVHRRHRDHRSTSPRRRTARHLRASGRWNRRLLPPTHDGHPVMEAYLAARVGDEVGKHASLRDALGDIALALEAGVATLAIIVAVCNPVSLVAVAFTLSAVAGATAIAAHAIKRHHQEARKETAKKPRSGLHPHLNGSSCGQILGDGSKDTFIEQKAAARADIEKGKHHESLVEQGSKTVLVNNAPLVRENDAV